MTDAQEPKDSLILVADDDPDIRDIVSFRLRRAGYETVEASNGDDALKLAHERPPALCILDVMMPRVNGFEVARELRGDPSSDGIPILMLTASVQDEDVAEGFETGADEYLRKPFKTNELLDRVAALLDR
jgi:two-component system phosphate regulon response regulator PhoB